MTTKQIAPYEVKIGDTVVVTEAGRYVHKTVIGTTFRNGMTTLIFPDDTRITQNGYSHVTVQIDA